MQAITRADRILEKDKWKREFTVFENTITSLYEACKPEILTDNSRLMVFVFHYLRGIIDAIIQRQDIGSLRKKISDLLDQSVVTCNEQLFVKEHQAEYHMIQKGRTWDLIKIDFIKINIGIATVSPK